MQKMSKEGLELLKELEGLRLKAYQCTSDVWTIGYGHTGKDVYEGLEITKERADELLKLDIRSREAVVNSQIESLVNQNQFDAICTLVFRIGSGNFYCSTVKKEINKDPNNREAVEKAWLMWDGKGDLCIPGLVNRMNKVLDHYFKKTTK